MSEFENELAIAREAADAAAEIIRDFQQEANFEINYKGRNDLVTDADLAAEEAIKSVIHAHFPDDHILAEESSQKQGLTGERNWIIDPIDGTTNFAHGFPVYCVSIALWENHQPKAGLILEVNSQQYFEAEQGQGATCNGEAITVSSIADAGSAMIGTGFPYNDMQLIENYVAFFKWLMQQVQALRRPGAASYDLCCVAAGWYDGFYEYSLNPWDVGAAALILQEAGGVVTDWQGGGEWLFGQRIVAGNAAIHRFLLEAIQEHFSDKELISEA